MISFLCPVQPLHPAPPPPAHLLPPCHSAGVCDSLLYAGVRVHCVQGTSLWCGRDVRIEVAPWIGSNSSNNTLSVVFLEDSFLASESWGHVGEEGQES